MANKHLRQNFSQNPDPQEKATSESDITLSRKKPGLLDKPPKSLLEWLVRVHVRLDTVEHEKTRNTS